MTASVLIYASDILPKFKFTLFRSIVYWANGKDAALDISIVNPLQQALVGQVAREGSSGVQHSFNLKVRKYSGRLAVHPHHCGHLWGMAQGVLGGAHQAGKAGWQADREGGGGDSETVASEGSNSFGAGQCDNV